MAHHLVQIKDLDLSFGTDPVFSGLEMHIEDQAKLGIIGRNGSGKSSLFRLIQGQLQPDAGEVVKRRGLHVVTVEQETAFDNDLSLEQALQAHLPPHNMNPGVVATVLGKLGFTDPSERVGNLSGGWRKRLAIGTGLVQEPELLLLDEPTNHLDVRGILWLQDMLSYAPFAWVVITHDRYFLDQTARTVCEIDALYPGGLLRGQGSYQDFRQKKLDYLENLQAQASTMRNQLRKENDWLARQPKARTTKSQSRVDAAYGLQDQYAQLKAQLQSAEKGLRFDFASSGRASKELLRLTDVAHGYEQTSLLKDLTLTLTSGMRLGLLGENGSGKSTLIQILAGSLKPNQQGKRWMAQDLRCTHFDQHREQLDPQQSLKNTLGSDNDQVIFQDKPVHVVSWANRFGFQANELDRPVSSLSGGEQARLLLAKLMLVPSDMMLLDEPTNDLDIVSIEALEAALASYHGSLVVISHDRAFLSQTCNHFLALEGQGRWQIYASYAQWEKALTTKGKKHDKGKKPSSSSKASQKASQSPSASVQAKPKAKRLSYMEQREFDQMEDTIMQLEEELSELEAQHLAPGIQTDHTRLADIGEQISAKQSELERLYKRWAELEAKTAH